MSFDLAFLANTGNVSAADIRHAWTKINENQLEWQTNSDFSAFVTSLEKLLSDFQTAFFADQGSAEQGYLLVSLQGPDWLKAHHEIGGLLMMHDVICYDPQTGQATIELEPL